MGESDTEKRLRLVESEVRNINTRLDFYDQSFSNIDSRLTAMNDKKLGPILKKLDTLYNERNHRKGFVGGVVFAWGCVWALIGLAVMGIVKFFANGGS